MIHQKHSTGFTIVELLIVVVVIAILAAITIVAYNGISQRSKESAAKSALSQIHKKIALYKVDHAGALPDTLSAASVSDQTASKLTYWQIDASSYCLSFNEGGESYYALSTTPGETETGRCDAIDWVAGAPLGFHDTPGTNTALTSPISGPANITLYTVVDITDANFYYSGMGGLIPSTTNNRFYFQGATEGSTTAGYRIDTPASTNYTGAQANVRTAGKHIGWMQSSSDGTVRSFAYDKVASHSTTSMTPGAGWNFTHIDVPGPSASYSGVAAVVYEQAHDEQTRRNVMNWLAKKYATGQEF